MTYRTLFCHQNRKTCVLGEPSWGPSRQQVRLPRALTFRDLAEARERKPRTRYGQHYLEVPVGEGRGYGYRAYGLEGSTSGLVTPVGYDWGYEPDRSCAAS